jgi:transposase-like protein
MISLPAPDGPVTMATIRLGVMAIARVMRFLIQFFIFMSRNP